MPSLLTRSILFLSSYSPLLIIMAVKYHGKHLGLAIGSTVVASTAVVMLVIFLRVARTLTTTELVIEQLSPKDTEGVSYIVTYLIPFLDLKLEDRSSAVALLLLFAIVGVLYVHSNMVYINPILNLMGYHLFEVESATKKKQALLTRRSYVERGTRIRVVSLGDLVSLETSHGS